MSPAAENAIQRLDAARQKWWLFSLLTTLVLASCASFGLFFAFMLADALATFSRPWLVGLSATWLLISFVLVAAVAKRLLRGQRSMEAAARRVESEFPEVGNDLINLVQLSEDRKESDRAFRDAAVHEAAARVGNVPFDRAPAKISHWRRFVHCMQTPRDLAESLVVLSMLILAAWLCQHWIPTWESAASRLLAPWEFVPSVGSVEILKVTPENAQVLVGESVEIAAEIKNPEGKLLRAALFVTPENETESQQPMTVDDKRTRFKLTVPSVLKPFRYRLEVGDSQSNVFTIGVREKPVVEGVEVTFRYPAYLGRKSEQVSQKSLDLEAPQYTVAELRLRTSVPIAKGSLECDGESFPGRIEEGGNLLASSLPLLKNGSYALRLWNDAGHTDPNPRQNRIAVVADLPPVVDLLKPNRESTAAPGSEVSVTIQASDDHGLGRLRLEMKVMKQEGDSPIYSANKLGQSPECRADHDDQTVGRFSRRFDHDRRAASRFEVDARHGQARPDGAAPRGGLGQAIGQRLGTEPQAARDHRQLARRQNRFGRRQSRSRRGTTRRPARRDLEDFGEAVQGKGPGRRAERKTDGSSGSRGRRSFSPTRFIY